MELQVLPLAVTMMAGPQIVSAILLVTVPRAVPVSLAFVAGLAVATTLGVTVMLGIAGALGSAVDLGEESDRGSTGNVVTYVLIGLLVLLALKNWRGRAAAEPPGWLRALLGTGPREAFRTGLLVILLMPSDLAIMLTVGVHLERNDAALVEALPFIALTVLAGALPLLLRTVFRRRAVAAMPALREWMKAHGWLINIVACGLFIVLLVSGA